MPATTTKMAGKIVSESVTMSEIRSQLAVLTARSTLDLDLQSVEVLKRQAKDLVRMIQKAHYLLLKDE